MKLVKSTLVMFSIVLAGCASQTPTVEPLVDEVSAGPVLEVGHPDSPATFSKADLEDLPQMEASFRDVAYVGVPLGALLEEAGFPLGDVQEVKALATDGFSATYDAETILRPDVIVAYAQVDGPLASDDGDFRMVVPDGGGSLNVRYLRSLQVMP